MSRCGWLITGGLGLMGAVIGFYPTQTYILDGSVDYEVTIRPADGPLPRAVSVEVMSPLAAATAVAERIPQEVEGSRSGGTQRPFTGEPFRFPIMCGVRVRRALFREWTEEWPRPSLVVVWWPATGPRQAKAVSIPDLRTTRAEVIDLP